MDIFQSLNELLFPSRCIACGVLDQSLCLTCRRSWVMQVRRSSLHLNAGERLDVISALPYSSVVQRVLLASKESAITRADALIAEALQYSIRHFISNTKFDFITPIPSRASATRTRGRDFMESLARQAAMPLGIAVIPQLSITRTIRDQSGLNHKQRRNNLDGAFVTYSKEPSYGRVLMVDDVVTSGATLSEGAKALTYAGFDVVGAATAAVALTSKIT